MTRLPALLIPRSPLRSFALPLAILGVVTLSACGSAAGASSIAPAATTVPPITSAGTPSASTTTSTAAGQKVNANTASQAEVQQALAAAGVPSSAQWAREVVEYRPYPADDASFAKLRKELAKYNPAPNVVDQIVATLTL